MTKTIEDMKAKNLAKCVPADVGIEILPGISEKDREALVKYFQNFVKPAVHCVACEQELNTFKHAIGSGVAFVWDLVHGEARCSGCGWPARGHHYIKRLDGEEVCSLRNLFLQYHPNEICAAEAESSHV